MRLEQMYQNVLDLSFDDLLLKVERDSAVRSERLAEAASKNDMAALKSKPTKADGLTVQEKAIIKSLGLNLKGVQALLNAQ